MTGTGIQALDHILNMHGELALVCRPFASPPLRWSFSGESSICLRSADVVLLDTEISPKAAAALAARKRLVVFEFDATGALVGQSEPRIERYDAEELSEQINPA